MFDFTGTRLDLSVPEALPEIYELQFRSQLEGDLDLTGASFKAQALSSDALVLDIPVEFGPATGSLYLSMPSLAAARYEWELYAISDAGVVSRMIYGSITVISTLQAAELIAQMEDHPLKLLSVLLPRETGQPLELTWRGSSIAAAAAAEAVAAAASVEGITQRAIAALDAAEEALEGLSSLDAKLALFNDQITSAVIANPVTETWWIAGVDTLIRCIGEPGRSPMISTAGTWLLYDPEIAEWVDTKEAAVPEHGRSPYISARGTWVAFDDETQSWQDSQVPAQGIDGLDGVSVRRIVVASLDDIPTQGETCHGGVYYYVPLVDGLGYMIYAWLETADGSASWVAVGEANDIATRELHGLVKLGTDMLVADGSPVGVNALGEMAVPAARYEGRGAVQYSAAGTLIEGGSIGSDAQGRMLAQGATSSRYGAVELSYSGRGAQSCIGLTSNGSIGVRKAAINNYGVVKLGSTFSQPNSLPYLVGIGMTAGGQIANNLLNAGAMQHKFSEHWAAEGMPWLSEAMAAQPEDFSTGVYYSGLLTSVQFAQSEDVGLRLLEAPLWSAANALPAGVYLTESMDSLPSNPAVLEATVLNVEGLRNFTYSKVQANDLFALKALAATKADYATKVELSELRADSALKTETYHGTEVLTIEQYNALPAIDPFMVYHII